MLKRVRSCKKTNKNYTHKPRVQEFTVSQKLLTSVFMSSAALAISACGDPYFYYAPPPPQYYFYTPPPPVYPRPQSVTVRATPPAPAPEAPQQEPGVLTQPLDKPETPAAPATPPPVAMPQEPRIFGPPKPGSGIPTPLAPTRRERTSHFLPQWNVAPA